MRWLKKQYGDRLLSVVDHQDENHPHLHFYAVARDGESFDRLHPGRTAAAAAAARGADKKTQRVEYMNAMRAWQDDFSRECAANFGLARLGPGQRRLSRGEWKREKAQARAFAHPEMPKSLLISAKELEPRVVGKGLFKTVYETPEEVADRVNDGQRMKLQNLVNAAKQGKKAIKEAELLAKENVALRARNELMSESLQLFSPEEIMARRAEKMQAEVRSLEAELQQSEPVVESALERIQREVAEDLKRMAEAQHRPASQERDDGPEFGR